MPTRQSFDKALAELQQDILRMASLVEQNIYNAVQSLVNQNAELAAQVIMGDEDIDRLYWEIENKCVRLIATQQPIARDLRVAITGIKILLSLERMADHAVDIARTTMCLCDRPVIGAMEYIPRMARVVQQMVKDGLDAYVHGDVEKARIMCGMDDQVDYLFAHIFRDLLQAMREDPGVITQAAYLLYVSRYIERIADHATNIGEAVIYLETGEWRELN